MPSAIRRCTAVWSSLSRDRQRIIAELNKSFGPLYARLAGVAGDLPSNAEIQDAAQDGGEQAAVEYVPSFDEILGTQAPEPLISQHFQRIYPGEVSRGVNLIGPQRDDLLVTLNGMPAREFASNGEMWTLALALKMAQYRALCEYFDTRPVVILDDVFAQLDESRRTEILRFAAAQDQVLITAAAESDIPILPANESAESGEIPVNRIAVADLKRCDEADAERAGEQ